MELIFVLDPLPAWTPAFAPLKRLTYTPKHHLADPATGFSTGLWSIQAGSPTADQTA